MTTEQIKTELREGATIEPVPIRNTGGQQAGMPMPAYRLTCEPLGIVIECGHYRQAYKNREMLMLMFESALTEIIK